MTEWPYRVTVGFRTAEDRDEFLREHVERPCSDIEADLHLLGTTEPPAPDTRPRGSGNPLPPLLNSWDSGWTG